MELINVENALDWAYQKSLDGLPGMETSEELAQSYLKQDGSLESQVDSLIRWQNAKCATSGFITGLGGIVTLPVAIPANLSSVLYVQLRMIAAIAYMGGYNVRDDQVKTLAFMCVCGNGIKDILKDVGINLGTKVATGVIEKYVTRDMLKKITQAVGRQIITKAGSRGVINLTKMVPVVGGIIGATIDGFSTNTIGNVAKDMFIIK